jgi:dihydrofolate reductase
MRRLRYSVVMSLDGYIAGPEGEADWITIDPEVDFTAIFSQFDTLLVGRRTFDTMVAAGRASMPGMKIIVFSRTLRQQDYPEVAMVMDGQREALAALKAAPGKDIWLFGGGSLFGSLAADGLVDTIEVGIVPILLGGGVPLLPSLPKRIKLSLTAHTVHRAGQVYLEYAIGQTSARNESSIRLDSVVRLPTPGRVIES